MKRKNIVGLILAAGLFLIGTVAYGYGNDYGPRSTYGGGYGSRCAYGHVYGAGCNVGLAYAAKTGSPYYGYRHDRRTRRPYYERHGYGNTWTGLRRYDRMGAGRCR